MTLRSAARALLGRSRLRLALYHHEAYRLALTSTGSSLLELRRSVDALQYLLHQKHLRLPDILVPPVASYEALLRVHSADYLGSLLEAKTLARIFSVDADDIFIEGVMRSLRLACGGTLSAARRVLAQGGAALNLFGGFHHAKPDAGGGFCALNDIAVAIEGVRAEGFAGHVSVVDLDFHPPDGTAACLERSTNVWLGSISGADWGPLPGRVDETVLPVDTDDGVYLSAVEALLGRRPRTDLVFVVAGADVLNGDPLGGFALTMNGIRRRDLLVAANFAGVPQVWLPAGGYTPSAWRVLAGTALAAGLASDEPIPLSYDPLAEQFSYLSRQLQPAELGGDELFSVEELDEALGHRRAKPRQFLDFYSAEGLELALERFAVLPLLRRAGFNQLAVELETTGAYDRARLVGRDADSAEKVVLVELEAQRRLLDGRSVLFVNWFSLRNPRAHFSDTRPQLPGQEVPGLGIAREMTTLLGLMAKRLDLEGVAFQPSWYHMAYTARHTARFVDPARQGRFEAMVRDLRGLTLLEATRAIAEGTVKLNGAPYAWEPDVMVSWRSPEEPHLAEAVQQAKDTSHFTVQ